MRRMLAVVTLTGLVAILGDPASATPGCVTRPEYRRVEVGMRQARVRAIFDTPGERIHEGPHREEYAYDICQAFRGVVVFVTYRDNEVTDKSWVLGE